ncbi:hypothetical protein ZWY2020_048859 [Hordeum vulgare]|nr:hypothetical protein ZWY2020_048859 [Hordeum vulgare]
MSRGQRRAMLTSLLVAILLHLAGGSPPEPVACTHGASTARSPTRSAPSRTASSAARAASPTRATSRSSSGPWQPRRPRSQDEGGHEVLAQHPQAGVPRRPRRRHHKHGAAQPDGAHRRREGAHDGGSGMVLRDLVEAAGAAGLSLPNSPYWYGLTIRGLLSTGAHGSSLWGKGGAAHEYVVGMRIVTPAPASQGYAVVRELGADHPDLDAAKVSLGVLGVVSQVTLALQPLFKRSVTFVTRDDSDFAEQVAAWGGLHEFGDMAWLPQQRKVVYREDNRVDASSPGDGLWDSLLGRSIPTRLLVNGRAAESSCRRSSSNDTALCAAGRLQADSLAQQAYGYTNDSANFTGYPVVGVPAPHQASGTCINSPEDGLNTSCPWDPRIRGSFSHNTDFSVALSKAPAFVAEMQQLRDLKRTCSARASTPGSACSSATSGVLRLPGQARGLGRLRHRFLPEPHRRHAARTATWWTRSSRWRCASTAGCRTGEEPQLRLRRCHREVPKAGEFLRVKDRYDPDRLFSSEWSDQVLGIDRSPNIVRTAAAWKDCVFAPMIRIVRPSKATCAVRKGARPGEVCSTSVNP